MEERLRQAHKHVEKAKQAREAAAAEREKAERALREIVRDRDHWKLRAVKAEAALKSAGIKQ